MRPVKLRPFRSFRSEGGLTGVVINVKKYGAKGDGVADDLAAINAAYADCPVGGTLYFPGGVYNISAGLVFQKTVHLKGCGASSVINLTSATANVKAIEYINYGHPVQTVTADIVQGDTIINLSGVTGLTVGDVIRIGTALYAYPADTNYFKGTIRRIKAINGNQITVDPMAYGYTLAEISSVTLSRSYKGLRIEDLKVKVQPDRQQYGLRINAPVDFTFKGLTIEGNTAALVWDDTASNNTADNQAGLQVLLAFDGLIQGNKISGFGRRADGQGYGIHVAGHRIIVEKNQTSMCKHGVVTSENAYQCTYVITRRNTSYRDYVGFDIHDHSAYCEISENTVVDLGYHGAACFCWARAPFTTIRNNYGHTSNINHKDYGIMVDNHAQHDISIYGNDILAGWYAISFSNLVTGTVPAGFSIHDNTFAADNPIYYGAFSAGLAWGLSNNTLIDTR